MDERAHTPKSPDPRFFHFTLNHPGRKKARLTCATDRHFSNKPNRINKSAASSEIKNTAANSVAGMSQNHVDLPRSGVDLSPSENPQARCSHAFARNSAAGSAWRSRL